MKNISTFKINKEIQRLEEIVDNIFKKCEVSESIPDKTELRDDVNIALEKKAGKDSELVFDFTMLLKFGAFEFHD